MRAAGAEPKRPMSQRGEFGHHREVTRAFGRQVTGVDLCFRSPFSRPGAEELKEGWLEAGSPGGEGCHHPVEGGWRPELAMRWREGGRSKRFRRLRRADGQNLEAEGARRRSEPGAAGSWLE